MGELGEGRQRGGGGLEGEEEGGLRSSESAEGAISLPCNVLFAICFSQADGPVIAVLAWRKEQRVQTKTEKLGGIEIQTDATSHYRSPTLLKQHDLVPVAAFPLSQPGSRTAA
jgi:hypothetical protein